MSFAHRLASLSALIVLAAGGVGCQSGVPGAGAVIDASPPVPCAVEGGVCYPGQICVHVCDCCGAPEAEDAGLEHSGHDICVDDTGQCARGFFQPPTSPNLCACRPSGVEADCPCG